MAPGPHKDITLVLLMVNLGHTCRDDERVIDSCSFSSFSCPFSFSLVSLNGRHILGIWRWHLVWCLGFRTHDTGFGSGRPSQSKCGHGTRRRRELLLCLSHTDYHRPPGPRLQEGKRMDRPCWLGDLMVKYLRLRSLVCVPRSVIWR